MEKPFNLTIARLNRVNGKLSRNFPPKANRIARPNNPKKNSFLIFFDIFFEDISTTNLSKQ